MSTLHPGNGGMSAVTTPGTGRVVFVGELTRSAGTEEMIEVARLLRGKVSVELIGPADKAMRPLLDRAQASGAVVWWAASTARRVHPLVEGSLAGLSLRHHQPPHRVTAGPEIAAYMAAGVPTVCTPHPSASALVAHHAAGLTVGFAHPRAAADAVLRLRDDAAMRIEMGRRGREAAREEYASPARSALPMWHPVRWARRMPHRGQSRGRPRVVR